MNAIDPDRPVEKTGQDARQGVTPHVARNVLVWGTILVVIAFAIVWFIQSR